MRHPRGRSAHETNEVTVSGFTQWMAELSYRIHNHRHSFDRIYYLLLYTFFNHATRHARTHRHSRVTGQWTMLFVDYTRIPIDKLI